MKEIFTVKSLFILCGCKDLLSSRVLVLLADRT